MYTIKAYVDGKEYTLHDARVKALTVGGNPYFEIGDNINGSASFTVYPTHPYYGLVKKLTTDIVIYRDDVPEFYGRVLYDDEDFSGTKKVFAEGELAFLCDSIQRPKVYHNTSVKAYVQDLIDRHNAQVEERKQFVVGRVTVKDSNDSLYRYSNWEDTRTVFKEKLTERLGGHLVIRHENGLRILDYLADEDYYSKNEQEIRFGRNLLDFSRNVDASDLVTCVIPLGAKLDKEDQDPALEAISEQRLTIVSVNGGVDYVTDDNAVKEYGKIYKTVTWDDVTVPENLKANGEEYLKSTQFEKMVLELKAIDLNLTDESFQKFDVGNKIRCISTPNGLDREFPLTKQKIYISSFKNNTVTLGDETSLKSYTSSNRQSTAQMEETIKALPSKSEILQEAIRDAQDLINKQVASGYAIHVPNEFIVADDKDYQEKAKNLWRWGLGGLAHYSQGYDGPIDGVALTMDGNINGKMLLANSVQAESLDVGYRESVESKISNAQEEAEKAAKEEIETSINNLENKINMSVRSVKQVVSRKNYVTSGEQETLSKDGFTLTGTVATVTEEEYLNLNCLRLEFTATGIMNVEQSLGELEAGTYTVSIETAYPTGKRPTYLSYGFSGNRSTAYYSGYTAEEFHAFSKTVKITKASKTVSFGVYGAAGQVCYLTNLRCLRDLQEVLDDMDAKMTVEVGKVSASVSEVYENVQHDYCTNPDFSASDDKFNGWTRNSTTAVTQTRYSGKSCAQITGTSSFYWRQNPFSQAGKIKVRFKAACASGNENTARLRIQIDGKNKYTSAGDLTTEWQTFEFEDNATPSSFNVYFYNYVSNTTVYITDVEILGYYSGYSESQFSVMKDSIESSVKKGDFASYVTQYYDRVITAFNNSSKYVQLTAGEIAIYDSAISTSKKRSSFDESGNHFYRDGYYVGKVGTNEWKDNNAHKGLVFDLEPGGKYMAFAQKTNDSDDSYTTMLAFSRANSIYSSYGIHLGCDLDMHGYTLKNPSFEGGGITGTLNFVQVTSVNSDGSFSYASGCNLQFKNGILIGGSWNG